MPADGTETVLCVPDIAFRSFFPAGWGGGHQGFLASPGGEWYALTRVLREARWLPRTKALEEDPTWKQIATYGVLRHENQVAWYRRASEGDDRLSGKYSVGFGGHVNKVDAATTHFGAHWKTVANGLEREIVEELGPEVFQDNEGDDDISLVGLINDDSTPVGRFHLGLVYLVTLRTTEGIRPDPGEIAEFGWSEASIAPSLHVPERDPESGEYLGSVSLKSKAESWSQLLLPHLPGLIGAATERATA